MEALNSNIETSGNSAMLWTGGKDSVLALHEAMRSGLRIRQLVTFAPPNPEFLAHPIPFLKLQAEALGLPHGILSITKPFREGYEDAIGRLKENGIHTLVTGDIAEVACNPNWIQECAAPSHMKVLTPVWGWDRLALLQHLLADGYKVVFSCVKSPWFTADWTGRELDVHAVEGLQALRAQNGVDLCGENGEYHPLVCDAPLFRQRIHIRNWSPLSRDGIMCMNLQAFELVPK